MELITGGAHQGKLAYAKGLFPEIAWADGKACSLEALKGAGGVYDFQELIRRRMKEGEPVEELADWLYRENPNLVVVTNEVGCGVVPAEPFDRDYREKTGRICTALAQKSARVHLVLCGIGRVIKGA